MFPLSPSWAHVQRMPPEELLPPKHCHHERIPRRRVGKRRFSLSTQALEEKATPSPAPTITPLPKEPQAEEKESHPVGAPVIELNISSISETIELSKKPLVLHGTLNHAPICILVDSGAMGNFVSADAVARFSLATHDVVNIPLSFANGARSPCNKAILAAYLCFDQHDEKIDLRVAPLIHYDIILGKPWLEEWNPSINWHTNCITFNPTKNPPILENPPHIPITLISLADLDHLEPEDL